MKEPENRSDKPDGSAAVGSSAWLGGSLQLHRWTLAVMLAWLAVVNVHVILVKREVQTMRQQLLQSGLLYQSGARAEVGQPKFLAPLENPAPYLVDAPSLSLWHPVNQGAFLPQSVAVSAFPTGTGLNGSSFRYSYLQAHSQSRLTDRAKRQPVGDGLSAMEASNEP